MVGLWWGFNVVWVGLTRSGAEGGDRGGLLTKMGAAVLAWDWGLVFVLWGVRRWGEVVGGGGQGYWQGDWLIRGGDELGVNICATNWNEAVPRNWRFLIVSSSEGPEWPGAG